MHTDDTGDASRLTVEEYEQRLRELIRDAHSSDVDVEGSFIVGDPTDDTYWAVEITKFSRSCDGDGADG